MNAPQPVPRLRPDDATIADLTVELNRRFGNRVVTSLAVRKQHANTLTWTENQPPDIVVLPQTTGEVVDIVKLAPCAGYRSSPSEPAPPSRATRMRPMAAFRSIPA